MKIKLRRRTKNSVAIISAIIIIVAVCTINFDEITEAPMTTTANETPSWMMDGATVSRFNEIGKLEARIDAKQLRFFNSDKRLELETPSVEQGEANSDTWQIAWHATANQGVSYAEGKELALSGNVNVYNLLHYYHLTSQALDIDGNQGILSSNHEVAVIGPEISLSSHGVNANWFDQTLELNKHVRVLIETH